MELRFSRLTTVRGRFAPPSDKSLTHRAFMFAAAARTPSLILNPLMGEDCLSTLSCLRGLGASSSPSRGEGLVIEPATWSTPSADLDCGNSGTTMRLLSGLIASRPIVATMVGDHSLSKRPMKRIAEPLRLMGAGIEGDFPPLKITGGELQGIDYTTPVASAQIKSCVLLAGLRAKGQTTVTEPSLSRDHTERMLSALGVKVHRDGLTAGVEGGAGWDGFEFRVPGDISSAAFFMVLAALHGGSEITLDHVGVNPSRTGIVDVFEQVGVPTELSSKADEMGEPVADITIRGGGRRPFEIGGAMVPRLIDEIPVLAVLATQLEGTSVIKDAQELRVKETDRIKVVCDGLRAMGADIEPTEDGMVIHGPTPLTGATIDASGDHRIGMSFAIAGTIASGETTILNAESIATSYPQFVNDMERVSNV